MSVALVVLLCFACYAVCSPVVLNNFQRIQGNPTSYNVAIGAGMNLCTDRIVTLSNDTIKLNVTMLADGTSKGYGLQPYGLAMHCVSEMCAVVNPPVKKFALFNTTSGETVRPAGGTLLQDPRTMYVVQYDHNTYEVYGIDSISNTSYSYNLFAFGMFTTLASTSRLIRNFTNVNFRISSLILMPDFINLGIAFEGDTTLRLYNVVTGNAAGTWGTFGNVSFVTRDYYNRIFVYDSSCLCIKIHDAAGNWIYTVDSTTITNPRSIAHTRNHFFILDDTGILQFSERPINSTSFNSTQITCIARGASASFSVSGGAAPYTYQVFPDQTFLLGNSTSFSSAVRAINSDVGPYYIYTDFLHPSFTDMYNGNGQHVLFATSSSDGLVTPSFGSYMYSMLFVNGAVYGFASANLIDTAYFLRIEFWINIGNGGQNFSISLDGQFTMTYINGSLPQNQWTNISIDLSAGNKRYYSTLQFADYSLLNSTSNYVYLDQVVMIPHPVSTLHQIIATDFCGVKARSPQFKVGYANPLTLNVQSNPTSCYPAGVNGVQEGDGTLAAEVQGGTPPYTYAWSSSLGNSTSNSVTGLSRLTNKYIIYDEQLNSTFVDSSFAADFTFKDTRAHTGSVSISFAATLNDETISFSTAAASGFNASRYSAFEFWVNGGDIGQQLLTVGILRNTAVLGNVSYLHNLLGLPSIPPNVWLRARLPITSDMVFFTGITIRSVGNWRQPRIYFDDLSFVRTRYSVSVSDATGCALSSQDIVVSSPDVLAVNTSVTELTCYQSGDGAVALYVSGGTVPYSYEWSIASVSNSSTETASLSESEILVSIRDSHGCKFSNTIVVDVLQAPPLGLEYEVTDIECFGGTGSIVASAHGGYPPYSYTWSTSSNTSYSIIPKPLPTPVFTDSFASRFALQGLVKQTLICKGTGSHLVTPEPISPSYSGYCSLAAYPNIENRTLFSIGCPSCIDTKQYSSMEFHILLDNPEDAQFLLVGLYTTGVATSEQQSIYNYTNNTTRGWKKVIVDFSSATQQISDTVNIKTNQSGILISRFLVDDVVLVPKGTLDTGIAKFVGQGFKSAIVGTGGQYVLTVSDSKNCPLVSTFNISSPSVLLPNGIVHGLSGHNKENGRIELNYTGGTPPYFYIWDTANVQNDSIATNLGAGSYLVTVTDSRGCMINSTFTVTNPAKSQTPMIAGIGVGVGIFVIGAAIITGFLVHHQRVAAVKTLKDVEEGERRAYKIDFDNMDIRTLLGAGPFGEVFSGEYKGTDVAIKKLKSQQMSKQQIVEFSREAAVMVGLRHPNILLFMGVCLEPQRLCIVTELMPRGNLSDILRNKSLAIPVQTIFNMAFDILKGLQFIHTSGFIHRDLKSPNLLVDKHGNIKIADFGLSYPTHASIDETQVSLLWTAPEILNREQNCYSYASDMYAFGIIMWELLSKELPYEDTPAGAITSMVVGGQRPPIPSSWDPISTKLITSSWAQDPAARPTVKDARAVIENDILTNFSDLEIEAASSCYKKVSSAHYQVPPPANPFAIVAANVAGLSLLWEENPHATCKALEDIVTIFHELAAKLNGYEISHDAPYIFGFASASNAINFCLRVSTILRNHKWDQALLACSNAVEARRGATVLYRGLRLHMAIHWGSATLRKDANNGRVEYSGPSLAIPVDMLSHAHGGAVVICSDMNSKLIGSSALEVDPYCIKSLGERDIQSTPMNLQELVPALMEDLLYEERAENLLFKDKDPWMVDRSEITLGSMVGTGTYGNVYRATFRNKEVAAKRFITQNVTSQTLLEMKTECAVLRKLHHENIIRFEAMCIQTPNHYLLTELMEFGSLHGVLADTSLELPWTLRMSFSKDIANGLAYLHKNNIIHRDIKSTNLLVSANWAVKIADFGFSRIKAANQTMTQCGTVAWTAPEIFDGSHYTEKADVYSYAVVLWELIFRMRPWSGKHSMKIIQIIEAGGRLPLQNAPQDTPQNLLDLTVACWDQNPAKRPLFEEILEQLKS